MTKKEPHTLSLPSEILSCLCKSKRLYGIYIQILTRHTDSSDMITGYLPWLREEMFQDILFSGSGYFFASKNEILSVWEKATSNNMNDGKVFVVLCNSSGENITLKDLANL